MERIQIAPGPEASVSSGFSKAGGVITTVDPMITSLIDFGEKHKTILRRIGIVMDAVQTIAEAGDLSSSNSAIPYKQLLVDPPLC